MGQFLAQYDYDCTTIQNVQRKSNLPLGTK